MEQAVQYLITGYLAIMSIIGFVNMGMDKRKAIKREWRIPEQTLLLTALVGGGIGSFLGMMIFHHKTKHFRFVTLLPFTAVGYIILILKLYNVL